MAEKKKSGGVEEFINNVNRLLRYASKPSRDDVYQIAKIILISIIVIGFVGFVLKLIMQALVGT